MSGGGAGAAGCSGSGGGAGCSPSSMRRSSSSQFIFLGAGEDKTGRVVWRRGWNGGGTGLSELVSLGCPASLRFLIQLKIPTTITKAIVRRNWRSVLSEL